MTVFVNKGCPSPRESSAHIRHINRKAERRERLFQEKMSPSRLPTISSGIVGRLDREWGDVTYEGRFKEQPANLLKTLFITCLMLDVPQVVFAPMSDEGFTFFNETQVEEAEESVDGKKTFVFAPDPPAMAEGIATFALTCFLTRNALTGVGITFLSTITSVKALWSSTHAQESWGMFQSPTCPSSTSCAYRNSRSEELQDKVHQILEDGGELEGVRGATSGVYLIKDREGNTVALFKPSDERFHGPHHRDPFHRRQELSEVEMELQHFIPGYAAERQHLAKVLDFGVTSCLPVGAIVQLKSRAFVDIEAMEKGVSPRMQEKRGYLQEWVPDARPLVEFHPEILYQFEGNPVIDQVPLEEFQKILIGDILLHNEDRHPGNILVQKDAEGNPHLVPIDMDMILPWALTNRDRGLFAHHRAKEQLTQENQYLIENIDPDDVFDAVKTSQLPHQAAINAKALAIVLKSFSAEGYSLREIQRFISVDSHLSRIIQTCQPGVGFWDQFSARIERELEIQRGKQKRNIVFGTTYISGNPYRDTLSGLVSSNQQHYANLWRLEGRVVTDNLLVKKCNEVRLVSANHQRFADLWQLDSCDISEFRKVVKEDDCVPYWNKVAVLRNWLKEPTAPHNQGKEEWYVIADDDMVVTNLGVNPYEAIDLLRNGKDTSIIIVQDLHFWKKGDPLLSVNTGLILVRKDDRSRSFIEQLWQERNAGSGVKDPHCPTLGTCKNQATLHEQEGFARVLERDKSLLGETITIVKPRDLYRDKELALNTFKRDGFFKRIQEYWGADCFSYKDPAEYQWRARDWMGQTAGVPVFGVFCQRIGKSSVEPSRIREEYLRNMLAQVVDAPMINGGLPGADSVKDAHQASRIRWYMEVMGDVETAHVDKDTILDHIKCLDYFTKLCKVDMILLLKHYPDVFLRACKDRGLVEMLVDAGVVFSAIYQIQVMHFMERIFRDRSNISEDKLIQVLREFGLSSTSIEVHIRQNLATLSLQVAQADIREAQRGRLGDVLDEKIVYKSIRKPVLSQSPYYQEIIEKFHIVLSEEETNLLDILVDAGVVFSAIYELQVIHFMGRIFDGKTSIRKDEVIAALREVGLLSDEIEENLHQNLAPLSTWEASGDLFRIRKGREAYFNDIRSELK